jgi:guanyl-specific ribonuclease Sa
MPRWAWSILLVIVAIVAANGWLRTTAPGVHDGGSPAPAFENTEVVEGLPPEAVATLQRIRAGGPFPYDRDGAVFQNRERRLPARPRGHYREYTVVTPGSPDRGARRIVSGGDPPTEFWYTDDHYRSFRRVEVRR